MIIPFCPFENEHCYRLRSAATIKMMTLLSSLLEKAGSRVQVVQNHVQVAQTRRYGFQKKIVDSERRPSSTRHHDDRYYCIDLLTRDSWGCLYSPPSSGAGPAYWCSAGPKCQCDDSEPPIEHNCVARVGTHNGQNTKTTPSGICCDIGLAGPDSRLL